MNKEQLKQKLMEYFDIGTSGCIAYNCIRDKSAFQYGTMSLDDFEEFSEDTIDDIINFIFKDRGETNENKS